MMNEQAREYEERAQKYRDQEESRRKLGEALDTGGDPYAAGFTGSLKSDALSNYMRYPKSARLQYLPSSVYLRNCRFLADHRGETDAYAPEEEKRKFNLETALLCHEAQFHGAMAFVGVLGGDWQGILGEHLYSAVEASGGLDFFENAKKATRVVRAMAEGRDVADLAEPVEDLLKAKNLRLYTINKIIKIAEQKECGTHLQEMFARNEAQLVAIFRENMARYASLAEEAEGFVYPVKAGELNLQMYRTDVLDPFVRSALGSCDLSDDCIAQIARTYIQHFEGISGVSEHRMDAIHLGQIFAAEDMADTGMSAEFRVNDTVLQDPNENKKTFG